MTHLSPKFKIPINNEIFSSQFIVVQILKNTYLCISNSYIQ